MSSSRSARDRLLMDERAAALAARTKDDSRHKSVALVVEVKVGRSRIGIPARGLWRIIDTPPVSPLPAQPRSIRGLAAVNGELVSVIDTRVLVFEDPATAKTAPFLAIVEDESGRRAGLLVDEVLGHRELFEENVRSSLARSVNDGGSPFSATTADLLSLLDLKKLFAMRELRMGSTRESLAQELPATHGAPNKE